VIKAGERKAKITVAVIDDALNEDNEELLAMLGTDQRAGRPPAPSYGDTADNDPSGGVIPSGRLRRSEGAGMAVLDRN
jgi:hypothetical protein